MNSPAYYIAGDVLNKEIVMVIRGTKSMADVCTDLTTLCKFWLLLLERILLKYYTGSIKSLFSRYKNNKLNNANYVCIAALF